MPKLSSTTTREARRLHILQEGLPGLFSHTSPVAVSSQGQRLKSAASRVKDSENEEQTKTEESRSSVAIVANMCPGNTHCDTTPSVIMATFQADALAPDGSTFPVNIYVDQGATYSAIRLSLAQQHKLKVKGHAILDQGWAGMMTRAKTPATRVSLDLRRENGMPFRMAAFALEVVASAAPLQAAELSPRILSKLGTIGNVLNMPPTEPREYRIDLILGADHYSQVMGKRTPLGGGLEAYRMPFGIVMCGPVPGPGLARQGVHSKEMRGNACLLATVCVSACHSNRLHGLRRH